MAQEQTWQNTTLAEQAYWREITFRRKNRYSVIDDEIIDHRDVAVS
jgi:hypothetical protein